MKKLLITAPHLISHGGGEQLILDFYKYFKKKNKVNIWTWRVDAKKTFPEFSNEKIVKVFGKNCRYLEKILTWINLDCKKFDIVLATGFPSYFCSLTNKNVITKIMIIPEYVKNPLFLPLKFIDSLALKKCKKIIVDCKSMQKKLKKVYGCNSIIINPGINLNLYKKGKFENYFLHVSRLDKEKNVDKLIKEWNLKDELIIVGDGEEEYKKYIINLSKGKNIKFVGNKNKKELAKLYSNCNGLLLAAEDEPFGLVILEGVASGKPIIAINNGGPKDLIKQDYGFLCKNQKEIVEKAKILSDNKKLAKTMGNKAFELSKNYSLKNYLSKIEIEIN